MAGFLSIFDFTRGKDVGARLTSGFAIGGASGTVTKSGETISPTNALDEAVVLSCVNVISQGIAQLPLEVIKTAKDEVVPNTAVARLMRKPNAYQTPYEFKYSVVSTILTHGECFLNIKRTSSGDPIALVPMDPRDISLSSDSRGLPAYHHESQGTIESDDIIHIKDINTYNVGGQSRVELASELIGAYKAGNRQVAETFRNGVNVQNVVTSDAIQDNNEAQKLSDILSKEFGQGGERNGGWAVLGNASVTQLKGSTPADSDLRSIRKDLINEIAALFRVPGFMVGGSGDEKYSNVRQKQTAFYRDTLLPIITSIEEALLMKLMKNNANSIRFNVDTLLRGDQESQMRLAVQGVTASILTPNEARHQLGFESLEGGDELRLDLTPVTEEDQNGSVDEPDSTDAENPQGEPDEGS